MERNKENLAKFDHILNLAKKIDETYEYGVGISYTDVNAMSQNAIVSIDTSSPVLFDTFKLKTILAEMITTADDFIVANVDDTEDVRLSFGVRNVWEP